MTKIKICGIKTKQDIDIVNAYLPDFIGFVFVPASKRYVTSSQAKDLKQNLKKEIKAVGVFQNADKKTIAQAVNLGIIDVIQLHGEEDQEYIDSIRSLKCPIIKAYKIKDKVSVFLKSDYMLLDNYKGGSGQSFDWSLIDFDMSNVFLAGGIDISNIQKAKALKPYCIDISSFVETNGKKDEIKIKEIIKAVRNG